MKTQAIRERSRTRLCRGGGYALLALWTLIGIWGVPGSVRAADTALHYYIVDRSYSIKTNHLLEPITDAVLERVAPLGDRDELRIIFFSSERWGYKRWPSMTPAAHRDFKNHFARNFIPQGETFLYDTVDHVLTEVLRDAAQFSEINLLILSDGEDSNKGKIRNWRPVEEKACRLVEQFPAMISLYTVGFDLPVKPEKCIRTIKVEKGHVVLPPDPPRAVFDAAPLEAWVGDTVTFFARRSPGDITHYTWTLDEVVVSGPPESHEMIRHAYATPGAKTIRLAVSGPGGQDEAVREGYVLIKERERPRAAFRWTPEQPVAGQTVAFVNESTGQAERYRWTLGSMGVATDIAPRVLFTQPGTQRVTLVAIKAGVADTGTADVVIVPVPPEAAFSTDPENEVELGGVVRMRVNRPQAGVSYTWILPGGARTSGVSAAWMAGTAGQVEFVLEASGPGGRVASRERLYVREPVVVEPELLIPRFRAAPREGKRPLEVTFTDRTEGQVVGYSWDFGDANPPSTDKNPVHTYTQSGSFTARLTVANLAGKTTTSAEPVVIIVKEPPPAWRWPAIIAAAVVLVGLAIFLKMRPKPPGGTIQWEDPEGGRTQPVPVTGTRFSLNKLTIAGWRPDGEYVIAVRAGERVVFRNDEEFKVLGRNTRFRIGHVPFIYLNELLDE
ncbi:MAG TPA: PKD domain-containing protein [Kiritimatiellia bacterium]|nr:PKD domain-containing protein [Kiritimatiellia bacterium]